MRRATKALKTLGFWALVAFVVLFSVFPFYYAILTSLESGSALFEVNYLPSTLALSNYVSVLTKGPFPLNFLNSVLVAVAVVAISLFLAVTAAFALSRVRFRGRGLLLLTILSVSVFPQITVPEELLDPMQAHALYTKIL